MIYFVTRWWGSKGIVEMEGEVAGNYFYGQLNNRTSIIFTLHTEAFPSKEAAELRVKNLALRKVEALRAQAERIEREWVRG